MNSFFAKILKTSSFLKHLERFQNKLAGRSLTKSEIKKLEAQQNTCEDWSLVRVHSDFVADGIRANVFSGEIYLGKFTEKVDVSGEKKASGIYHTFVHQSIIEDQVYIQSVQNLSRVWVESDAQIIASLNVSGGGDTNGPEKLPLGLETDGRLIDVFPEMSITLARDLCFSNSESEKTSYQEFLSHYRKKMKFNYSILSKGASLYYCSKVANFYIGEGAKIHAATCVENSIIISSFEEISEISDGAIVKRSVLQWRGCCREGALIENSMLLEYAAAEKHAKVIDSIIGPNSHIGKGEITASLVGPFVGFHHQSLLIAALWPDGKGNVGYGSNVGSNHTGKAPDQEVWIGEGMFFGLGCSIKFPSHFIESPYSVISTSVTTLPQKLSFPFSLVNLPSEVLEGVSPAFNEIIPGWVLSENLYMIRRNEEKYRQRDHSRRDTFAYRCFRPEIIEMVINACGRLESQSGKDFYLEKDIPGLGKNYLMEKNRIAGLKTYQKIIEFFCLESLFDELLRDQQKSVDMEELLSCQAQTIEWGYVQKRLRHVLENFSLSSCASRLIAFHEDFIEKISLSKQKDQIRGVKIIPDYEKTHQKHGEDEFFLQTKKGLENLKQSLQFYF